MRSATIFVIAALVGLLIFWVCWAIRPYSMPPDFLDHLLYLIWPTRILGVIEYNSGALIAALVTIGANVVIFGLIGLMVGFASGRKIALLAIYLLVSGLICLNEAWISGFDFASASPVVLVTALGFYAFLFWLSVRFASKWA